MGKVREQIQIQKQELKYGPSGYDPIALKNSMSLSRRCYLYVCLNSCVDDRSCEITNEVFLYLTGGSNVPDRSKRLWLHGSVGTGKSCILRIIQTYDRYSSGKDKTGYYLRGGSLVEVAAFVANQYYRKGIDGILSYDDSGGTALGLDEVGREPKVKHYETKVDVIQYILQMRYDNRRSCTTFVTVNLFPEEVHLEYGEYIADRVNGMLNVAEIGGKSRR